MSEQLLESVPIASSAERPSANLRRPAEEGVERSRDPYRGVSEVKDVAETGLHDNAERDAAHARDSDVEDARGLRGSRKRDDRRGISGEDRAVGTEIAQSSRRRRANRHPDGEREEKEFGGLREQGDQSDPEHRADDGAHQAILALRQAHAPAGLSNDPDRHRRPFRLLEVEPESNIKSRQRRRRRAQGEADRLPGQARRERGWDIDEPKQMLLGHGRHVPAYETQTLQGGNSPRGATRRLSNTAGSDKPDRPLHRLVAATVPLLSSA